MAVSLLQHRFDGPEHAPAVLMLPPLGTRWSVWEPQMPELTRACRVLRVNHRGHGASPAPAGEYTVEELGGDVLALLDAHGLERVSIVGCDLGGAVATWVAATAPRRVRRLAYVSGTAWMPFGHYWREVGDRARRDGMPAVSGEVSRSWFTPRYARLRPDVVARMTEELEGIEPDGFAGCCRALAELDQRRALARVRVPTVVVSAAHDPFLPPSHGRRLGSGIPGARLEVISGAAHLAGVERADRVNELLVEHLAV